MQTLLITTLVLALCGAALAAPALTQIPRPDDPWGALPQCMSADAGVIYGDTAGAPFIWVAGSGSSYLTTPGISRTHIAAASRDGLIAAGATAVPGIDQVPVRWVNRVPSILPTGSMIGAVSGLSADGRVAVGYTLEMPAGYRAAEWVDGGAINYLDVGMGWTASRAVDVSADGARIVGFFLSPETGSDRRLVLFENGSATEIQPPLDFLSERPYKVSEALRLTDDGSMIVAQLENPRSAQAHVFRWEAATNEWSDLGIPAGMGGMVLNAISADGGTIVGFGQQHQDFTAYVWTQPTGWYSFRQYLIDNSLPALPEPISITGVSDDGLLMCLHSDGFGYLLSMPFLPCPADYNQDGQVDDFDYLDFISDFAAENPLADFNRDGQVDFFDYLDFVRAFAGGC